MFQFVSILVAGLLKVRITKAVCFILVKESEFRDTKMTINGMI